MKKKITLKRFFQSHFPLQLGPSFLIFFNTKTNSYEIVGRSGLILCIIPELPGRSSLTQKKLTFEVVRGLEDILFGCDPVVMPVSSKLCLWDNCLAFDNGTDYEVPDHWHFPEAAPLVELC